MGRIAAGGCALVTLAALVTATALAAPDDEVPAPYARFEGMVGGWKGTAQPAANRFKGWQESHSWAWKFAKGEPVGMTVAIEGGKVFTKAELGFDARSKRYTLAATDPSGKAVTFTGAPTADGKGLVLDRTEPTPEGRERITIRPNASGVRYTMVVEHQAPGAPQYKKAIEIGLTKEGESFAAGGGASELPKCVITGGSATLSVSYNGKSYPLCCTGCRDEFNDNPEKYVARLAAKASAEGDKPAPAAKPAPGRSSGEFDGLVDDQPKAKSKAMPKATAKPKADDSSEEKPATKPAAKAKDSPEARAARDLRIGQASERNGKTKVALDYYRGIVKKYPNTDAAKTAAERIKALEN
jgi:YHS domain-containing protein